MTEKRTTTLDSDTQSGYHLSFILLKAKKVNILKVNKINDRHSFVDVIFVDIQISGEYIYLIKIFPKGF